MDRRPLLITVLVCGVVAAFAVHVPAAFAVVVISVSGLGMVAVLIRALADHAEEQSRLLRWAVMCFVLHLALGAAIQAHRATLVYIASDGRTYHKLAVSLVEHWTQGLPALALPHGKEGFPYLLAFLYRLFGEHPVAGIAMNAVLSAAIVPIVTDTTKRLFGRDAARYVPAIVVLLPGFLLWPSPLLREAGVLVLLALVANCAVRLSQRTQFLPLVLLGAALPVLFAFRGYIAMITSGAVLLGIMIAKRDLFSGITTGLGALMLLVTALGLGLGYSGYQSTIKTDLRDAQASRLDFATSANSGFDANVDISTPGQAIAYLPRAAPQFLLGPFPWQVRSVRQLPVFGDTLIWWTLVPLTLAGLREGWRRRGRGLMPLLLPAAGITASVSVVIANFGTIVRERPQVVLFLVPTIALGLSQRAARRAVAPPAASAKTGAQVGV